MRFVDRTTVATPLSLIDGGPRDVELAAARHYYNAPNKPSKSFKFKVYKRRDVELALRSLFHGKCAYCESFFAATQPADVDHFRPKAMVEECPTHPGYWWLAMQWENLLPSCIDCNRRRTHKFVVAGMSLEEATTAVENASGSVAGKESSFPTKNGHWALPEDDPTSSEQPLLINPTREDPRNHIKWTFDRDLPIASPREESSEGEHSIRIFALNRFSLVQARHWHLLNLRVLAEAIKDKLALIDGLDAAAQSRQMEKILELLSRIENFTAPEKPYSGMAQAFAQEFLDTLRRELARPTVMSAQTEGANVGT